MLSKKARSCSLTLKRTSSRVCHLNGVICLVLQTPRKRYWGLHPPQQPITSVIESGLWAVQSGLLVLVNEQKVTNLLAQGPSAKAAIIHHYMGVATQSFVR